MREKVTLSGTGRRVSFLISVPFLTNFDISRLKMINVCVWSVHYGFKAKTTMLKSNSCMFSTINSRTQFNNTPSSSSLSSINDVSRLCFCQFEWKI
jgi:hypothetical protein